jgi:nucleotide-binding universal stress UspA family protein
MYRHILIPTDGSEVAQKGVVAGFGLAKALGARVTLVTVSETLPVFADPTGLGAPTVDLSDYWAAEEESAKRALDGAKTLADQAGVSAETLHISRGRPAEAIVEAARSKGCDLIAMASHGRRGVGRLLLGSQTSEVLVHSPVPVLVVK